jgi:hypothetical protein
MIQKKVIDSIYKKFRKRPASPDELDIPLLFEKVPIETAIEIDGDHLVINSIESTSPFHSIPVSHIHAIIEFDEAVAIVLHSSIIFISKEDGSVHVHLKDIGPTFIDRVKSIRRPDTAIVQTYVSTTAPGTSGHTDHPRQCHRPTPLPPLSPKKQKLAKEPPKSSNQSNQCQRQNQSPNHCHTGNAPA